MVTSAICVPSFEGLILWSGNNCSQWSVRTAAEKLQWVVNYFGTHGIVVNEAAARPITQQMDAYCGSFAPAGAVDDVVATWRDSEGREHVLTQGMVDRLNSEHGTNYNPNDPNWTAILTSPAFANLIGQTFGAIGNTVVGVTNSANKTPYGYSPNSGYNNYGGLGNNYGGYGSGIYGGFNSSSGFGYGQANWTPIIIGGAVMVAIGVGLLLMNQKNKSSSKS